MSLSLPACIDAYMAAQVSFTALVSDRLYPERADQDATAPYVTYHLELRPSEDSLDLSAAGLPATGMIDASLDFIALSRSYDQVFQVAEIIRTVLSDFRGVMGGGTGLLVGSVQWVETQGGYIPGETAELGLFGALVKFVLQYVP